MESTAGDSRRGRRAFNDSLAPVDFSFSTYIRPFKSAGVDNGVGGSADDDEEIHAVEEALWALFSGPASYVSGDDLFTNQITPGTTVSNISFSQSNVSELGGSANANLYFELGDANKLCYKLSKVAINEASIDFDIDGVATINWSGFADTVEDITKVLTIAGTPSTTAFTCDGSVDIASTDVNRRIHATNMLADTYLTAEAGTGDAATLNQAPSAALTDNGFAHLLGPRATIYEGIDQTNNFIRNRLTKCIVVVPTGSDPQGELEDTYDLTLTGGNITLSNNISYLTPEELGTVNVPIGHVTGARNFGGSFTCYLTENTGNVNSSRDFFTDLTATDQRKETTNNFSLEFLIGGGTVSGSGVSTTCTDADLGTGTAAKRVALAIKMDNCHVDIPTHSIEDIITLETTFMALPSTIEQADEVSMRYKGPAKGA